MKDTLIKMLAESGLVKKLAYFLIDEIIQKKIKEIVAASSNTLDNSAYEILWPLLEKEAKEEVDEFEKS